LSYGEMVDQARSVCAATSLPVMGDGDTGYGNAINAERTLIGCAQAGLACVMIGEWEKEGPFSAPPVSSVLTTTLRIRHIRPGPGRNVAGKIGRFWTKSVRFLSGRG
jgi:2-methylisocitrate lyase-like PEP mutase family enzyme